MPVARRAVYGERLNSALDGGLPAGLAGRLAGRRLLPVRDAGRPGVAVAPGGRIGSGGGGAPAQVRLAGGADLVQPSDGRLVGRLVQDVRVSFASRAIASMASAKPSSVWRASVSVGSIIIASGTISGK